MRNYTTEDLVKIYTMRENGETWSAIGREIYQEDYVQKNYATAANVCKIYITLCGYIKNEKPLNNHVKNIYKKATAIINNDLSQPIEIKEVEKAKQPKEPVEVVPIEETKPIIHHQLAYTIEEDSQPQEQDSADEIIHEFTLSLERLLKLLLKGGELE